VNVVAWQHELLTLRLRLGGCLLDQGDRNGVVVVSLDQDLAVFLVEHFDLVAVTLELLAQGVGFNFEGCSCCCDGIEIFHDEKICVFV
jgi:hypothetical protein